MNQHKITSKLLRRKLGIMNYKKMFVNFYHQLIVTRWGKFSGNLNLHSFRVTKRTAKQFFTEKEHILIYCPILSFLQPISFLLLS